MDFLKAPIREDKMQIPGSGFYQTHKLRALKLGHSAVHLITEVGRIPLELAILTSPYLLYNGETIYQSS